MFACNKGVVELPSQADVDGSVKYTPLTFVQLQRPISASHLHHIQPSKQAKVSKASSEKSFPCLHSETATLQPPWIQLQPASHAHPQSQKSPKLDAVHFGPCIFLSSAGLPYLRRGWPPFCGGGGEMPRAFCACTRTNFIANVTKRREASSGLTVRVPQKYCLCRG